MQLSHEAIVDAYNALPDVVSSYLAKENVGKVVAAIGRRNNLHVDTVGTLAEAVTHMLLGLISPPELMREMASMRISDSTAASIAKELNEEIFKPLHAQMRSGTATDNRGSSIPLTGVPAPLGTTTPVSSNQPAVPAYQAHVSHPIPTPSPVDTPRAQVVDPSFRAPSSQSTTASRPYSIDPYREPIE